MADRVLQQTLDGGVEVAGLTPIQRQLAAIMWNDPKAQTDEDWLAALWAWHYGGMERWFEHRRKEYGEPLSDEALLMALSLAYGRCRRVDVRNRRLELAKMGLFPWPKEEAERRQQRAKGGPPGG